MSRENHEEDGAPPQRAEGTSVWEHLPWGKGGDLPWSHLPGGREGAMPPLPAWCSLLGGLTAQLARGGAHSDCRRVDGALLVLRPQQPTGLIEECPRDAPNT